MAYPEKIELFDSGSGGLTTQDDGRLRREVTLRWLLPNQVSYAAAEKKGEEIAPLDWAGHRRSRLDVRSLGNKWYELSADYGTLIIEGDGNDNNGDNGDDPTANTISFDTTGGSEHITQSFQTNNDNWGEQVAGSTTGIKGQIGHGRPGEGALVPDLEGAINVEGDQVKGTDKVVPVFNFSETWVFPASMLVTEYIATLYDLTGTVNKSDWRVFSAGEVLFMGARGEITRNAPAASITFSFCARPNRSTFKVGEIEVQSGKLGWEQMSVMYETSAGPATIIRRPKFVFINTVYGGKDFARLAIGNKFPQITPTQAPFTTPAP